MNEINHPSQHLQKMFVMHGLDRQISSARQLSDMMSTFNKEAEERVIKRRGAEAQIESSRILADQREELEVMRHTINALLKHNLEQAIQHADATRERDLIEAERHRENLIFTKIAAWTGIIGSILSVVAIILQLAF